MSRQKNNFSSGSPIVDQMYGMEITGNVIPLNWFKTITTANGKPNSTAIMLLSDIVYWYRPKILRDEATGEFIGIKKRFKADLLQRSYRQFSEQFGYSKRQVTEAIKALESLGVIRREFRTVSTNMQKLSNVLYIELFPDKLMELTYPEKTGGDISLSTVMPITLKSERVSHISDIDMIENHHTNTENTTENIITKDYPLPAEAAAVFKDQIHYEALISDLPFKKTAIDELVNIAAEVLTSSKKTIRVNKEERSSSQVKERFRKLNIEHIKYVLDELSRCKSDVAYIRAFLITLMYNAPVTIDSYYTAKVNRDMSHAKNR